MSGWRASHGAFLAAALSAAIVAGCSGQRQDIDEPPGNFPMTVTGASFPATQTLSQHTTLVIAVQNTGSKPIPDMAVTICNLSCSENVHGGGTATEAFAQLQNQPGLANPSKPVWIVDRPPGPCGFSCVSGGAGTYVTAYSNTWAVGKPVAPGVTKVFKWTVTAIVPGTHVIAYRVAAGLNGKAHAVAPLGGSLEGTLPVTISKRPQQSYVNDAGQVVNTP